MCSLCSFGLLRRISFSFGFCKQTSRKNGLFWEATWAGDGNLRLGIKRHENTVDLVLRRALNRLLRLRVDHNGDLGEAGSLFIRRFEINKENQFQEIIK